MSGRWNGIWIAFIAGAASLLLLHGVVYAAAGNFPEERQTESSMKLERFYGTSDRLYTAVIQGDRNGIYYELRGLSKLAGDSALRQYGHKEGWAAVDRSIIDAQQALNKGAGATAMLNAASRLRLAADSLVRGQSALWLQYEPVLQEDTRQLVIAWTTSGSQSMAAASARLATLNQHWELIEPAALLNRDPLQARMLYDGIQYSSRLLNTDGAVQTGWIMGSMQALTGAAGELFKGDTTAGTVSAEPVITIPQGPGPASPGGWLLYTLVPLICAFLAYAGWNNFRRGQHGMLVHPAPSERPSRNGVAGKFNK